MRLVNKVIYIKKKPAAIFMAVTLLTILCIFGIRSAGQPEQPVMSFLIANRTIVVDAGHGGIDPGTSHNHLQEKEITLAISRKLAKYLSQAGAQVINLRQSDEDLCGKHFKGTIRERKRKDLSLRVERAIQNKADLYISIHTNAELSPRWSGAQTFYQGNNEKSKALAECIQEEFKSLLGNTKREAKSGHYFILDKTTMPTVIAEVGFLSNPQEAKLLASSAYQDKVAYAIFCGVVRSQMPAEKKDAKDEQK